MAAPATPAASRRDLARTGFRASSNPSPIFFAAAASRAIAPGSGRRLNRPGAAQKPEAFDMAAKENLVRKAPASAGEPSKSGQSDAESAGAAKEAPERAFAAATFDALKEASHDLKRRIEEKRSSRHGAAGQTDESP